MIPFEEEFPIDKTLDDQLAAEAEGILAWMVEGCLQWQAEGLNDPDNVTLATAAYRVDSDPLDEFITTACLTTPTAEIAGAEFYRYYTTWADSQGLSPRERLSSTMFGRRMTNRFSSRRGGQREGLFGRHQGGGVTGLGQQMTGLDLFPCFPLVSPSHRRNRETPLNPSNPSPVRDLT